MFSLVQVTPEIMEDDGFMTYTGTNHQLVLRYVGLFYITFHVIQPNVQPTDVTRAKQQNSYLRYFLYGGSK